MLLGKFQELCCEFLLLYFRRLSSKLVLVVIDQVSPQLGQVLHLLLTHVAGDEFGLPAGLDQPAVIILQVLPQQGLGGEGALAPVAKVLSRGRPAGVEVEG